MNLEDFDPAAQKITDFALSPADQWILAQFDQAASEAGAHLNDYRFNDVAGSLYAFTWHSFCDWYIELAKEPLYGEDPQARLRTQVVLYTVLEGLLRLLHPLIPFVTEEIWQVLPGVRPVATIMRASYPAKSGVELDAESVANMESIMEVVRAIRNIRGELDVAPGRKIAVYLDCRMAQTVATLTAGEGYIKALARVDKLLIGVAIERPPQSAAQLAGEVEVLVPLAGVIDLAEEESRLQKEIAKLTKDLDFFERKLANEKFVANAPAAVLEKDRAKLLASQEKMTVLSQALGRIRSFMN